MRATKDFLLKALSAFPNFLYQMTGVVVRDLVEVPLRDEKRMLMVVFGLVVGTAGAVDAA